MPRQLLTDVHWSKLKTMLLQESIYDSTRLRDQIEAQASRPVIPRKRNALKGNADLDCGLYRYRLKWTPSVGPPDRRFKL